MQISSCVASLGASCLSVRAWALMRDADTRDSKYENRRWAWLREQTRKFRRCHRVCVCVGPAFRVCEGVLQLNLHLCD